MNKLAQYLNQHLLGEVVTDRSVLTKLSIDGSPLSIRPEIVVYPRTTNDIRKLARFASKLAEKGHTLGLTPRGAGTDKTGGAIGEGVVIATSAHMNRIFEMDVKQRLLRLQSGVSTESVQNALKLQGMKIGGVRGSSAATIGGSIASGRNFLEPDTWVEQLEVVLANGDVMQTKRLSKRELNRKKGEQTFEGNIYRAVDTLIEENHELIEELSGTDVSGYSTLRHVKKKDGSMDLAPLFFGSQGTLGIISELIVRTDFVGDELSFVAALFETSEQARDALDAIEKVDAGTVEYYDSVALNAIRQSGKTLDFIPQDETVGAVLLIELNDSSMRAQAKKRKKVTKSVEKFGGKVAESGDTDESQLAVLPYLSELVSQTGSDSPLLSVAGGIYIPIEQFDQFVAGLNALSAKREIPLIYWSKPLDGLWYVYAPLDLKSVTARQLLLNLIDEIGQLAVKAGGSLAGDAAEGRLYAHSAHAASDDRIIELYEKIRLIFDPKGILNPGVKQIPELSKLAKSLRSEYVSNFADGLSR